jgi:branched-chain amino acid transport system permease protein
MTDRFASLRSSRDVVVGAVPRWAWGLIFLAIAIVFPYLTGGGDFLDASIQTLAYVVMALGLNIVVGVAGLLDLGDVAF